MIRPTAAVLLLLAAACTGERRAAEPPSQPAIEPPVVTFVATDFAFEGPDTIAPGFTTIRMENRGPQEHHLILARLDEGKTIDSLMAFFQATPNADPSNPAVGHTIDRLRSRLPADAISSSVCKDR